MNVYTTSAIPAFRSNVTVYFFEVIQHTGIPSIRPKRKMNSLSYRFDCIHFHSSTVSLHYDGEVCEHSNTMPAGAQLLVGSHLSVKRRGKSTLLSPVLRMRWLSPNFRQFSYCVRVEVVMERTINGMT
jgi:hypothetical protein